MVSWESFPNASFFLSTTPPTQRKEMLSLLTRALSSFLSFAFIMAAFAKLVPSHPMHSEMLSKSPEWLHVLGLSSFGLTPDILRIGIGAMELILGLLLVVSNFAAVGLAIVMAGAVYTHFAMDGGKFTEEAVPAVVLLVLLGVKIALGTSKAAPTLEAEKEE